MHGEQRPDKFPGAFQSIPRQRGGFYLKKCFIVALIAALFNVLLCGCKHNNNQASLNEFGDKVLLGQLDRFEIGEDDSEWAVISIDVEPYSVGLPATEIINSKTVKSGVWVNVYFDGDHPHQMRLVVSPDPIE